MKDSKKLTILVSSTVYYYEELLDRIYTLLTAFNYEVWMSYKGTIPILSNRSNFDNCLAATENCDLFLGLITPRYGSGREGDEIAITHMELKRAIELNKPRWLLVHDHVVFARSLLNNIVHEGTKGRSGLTVQDNEIMDDLRVIEMYEEAMLSQTPLRERRGNWVQPFRSDDDAAIFATAQFSRYQEIEAFLIENFENSTNVHKSIKDKRGRL